MAGFRGRYVTHAIMAIVIPARHRPGAERIRCITRARSAIVRAWSKFRRPALPSLRVRHGRHVVLRCRAGTFVCPPFDPHRRESENRQRSPQGSDNRDRSRTRRTRTMRLPGFDAESSLGPAMGVYRGNAAFANSGEGGVLPVQDFIASSSSSPQLNAGLLGSLWPKLRCCKYSRFAKAVVCAERAHSPLEQCQCVFPECPPYYPDCSSFPDLPSVVCQPPVATF
jgi:hypothetical protein